ncbi:thymocyte nuclear protein 1 isoform X2 [Polypterus senegalus]|nr:thymocyte nuclear protein 1 isoform X2 [Polypterus senegalus]XP_039620088.1 thymocyte nuclear protein 1 isoform X2 [Polypterus senegalus]
MPPKKKKRTSSQLSEQNESPAKLRKKTVGLKKMSIQACSGNKTSEVKCSLEQKDAGEKGQKELFTYWLMKSEPESRIENGVDVKFGIEDLKAQPEQTGCWDGVRNYQARNYMKDMKVGQLAFFYHSNCKVPGIAGIIKVVKEAYVDHTQFDKKDPHYDPSSKQDNPKWYMVDVQFVRMTKRFISLTELKQYHLEHKSSGGALKNMALFTRARLSVQPLTEEPNVFPVLLNMIWFTLCCVWITTSENTEVLIGSAMV